MPPTADLLQRALDRHRTGDAAGAAADCRALLAIEPANASAWSILGASLARQSRWADAADAFRQLLRLHPDHAETLVNLGNVLARQVIDEEHEPGSGQPSWPTASRRLLDEAITCYRRALAQRPHDARLLNVLGWVLLHQGEIEESIRLLRQATALRPDDVRAWRNLADATRQAGDYDESERCCRHLLQRDTTNPADYNRLAVALILQDRPEEALRSLDEALRLQPDHAKALFHRGLALIDLGRIEEGRAAFRQAVRARPDYALARQSLGAASLLLGDFDEGWREYEARWQTPDFAARSFAAPRWDGGPLHGRTILLFAEQGLGDAIQFIRYAPEVKARGGRLVVECHAPLVPLLRRCPSIDEVVPLGAPLPAYDVYMPLLSLPPLLGTPATLPYLSGDPDREAHWRRELSAVPGLKVGIVWQGNPQHRRDRFRSIPLRQFEPLARVPGVRLISLQRGPGTEQLTEYREVMKIIDVGGRLEEPTLVDLAAALRAVDLLITCDTAPAHLAGALAVPVWVALPFVPDWRWQLHRDDSPWYPTMRLFRQETRGDWARVFARMAAELAR